MDWRHALDLMLALIGAYLLGHWAGRRAERQRIALLVEDLRDDPKALVKLLASGDRRPST